MTLPTKEMAEALKSPAEDVAAIAIELDRRMQLTDDKDWPTDGTRPYRYHVFGGFPGWWAFCTRCGLSFSRQWHFVSMDHWLEKVDKAVDFLWESLVEHRKPMDEDEIDRIVRDAMHDSREVWDEEYDDEGCMEARKRFHEELFRALVLSRLEHEDGCAYETLKRELQNAHSEHEQRELAREMEEDDDEADGEGNPQTDEEG